MRKQTPAGPIIRWSCRLTLRVSPAYDQEGEQRVGISHGGRYLEAERQVQIQMFWLHLEMMRKATWAAPLLKITSNKTFPHRLTSQQLMHLRRRLFVVKPRSHGFTLPLKNAKFDAKTFPKTMKRGTPIVDLMTSLRPPGSVEGYKEERHVGESGAPERGVVAVVALVRRR